MTGKYWILIAGYAVLILIGITGNEKRTGLSVVLFFVWTAFFFNVIADQGAYFLKLDGADFIHLQVRNLADTFKMRDQSC